ELLGGAGWDDHADPRGARPDRGRRAGPSPRSRPRRRRQPRDPGVRDRRRPVARRLPRRRSPTPGPPRRADRHRKRARTLPVQPAAGPGGPGGGGVFAGGRGAFFVGSPGGGLEKLAYLGGPTPLGGTFAGFDPPAAD